MRIMHIDANSAFLSWSAAAALEAGAKVDYRTLPAVVGGNQASRHGIVLAKSIPAKAYGIKTGESLMEARKKCPGLVVIPPDYDLYVDCSNAMYDILSEYSPLIQRYSIDECFLDYTDSERRFGDALETAYEIKDRIKKELGFTVNVGLSTNKLLAKMGSELKKPDMVHTLWPSEMAEKMYPLPVGELFMVGRASERKLREAGVRTIGELARTDRAILKGMLKSHGELLWCYANGIDDSPVSVNREIVQKGVGNGMTIWYDVSNGEEAGVFLLSLCEQVGMRMRKLGSMASVVAVGIRTSELWGYGHQVSLPSYTDSTDEIYEVAMGLFNDMWRGEPIRQLSVRTSGLIPASRRQLSMFDKATLERDGRLDRTVDEIRARFGRTSVFRGRFANSGYRPIEGGVNDGNYISMGGYEQ